MKIDDLTLNDLTLDTLQSIDIKADIGDVFRSVLNRFGEGFTKPPESESMQMTLEQWPGGRWFRDRGNGIGHLWGHLQVIKPPVLLELSGPMFMSYPALNHIEIKLEQRPGGTHVGFRHRAIGFIDPEHRQGVTTGWKHLLDMVSQDCSSSKDRRPRRAAELECLATNWTACGKLSDSTRRSILDFLRQGPRTTTQIVEAFPHLSASGS